MILFAQDSLALRNEMREAAPDVLTKFNFECESCAHTETVDMPIDTGFFWPSSEVIDLNTRRSFHALLLW